MKVTNREVCNYGTDICTTYKLSSGHELHQWNSGHATAYTPKGNYASQITLFKLCRIVSDYESYRVQIKD
jgi:hypothetical protein